MKISLKLFIFIPSRSEAEIKKMAKNKFDKNKRGSIWFVTTSKLLRKSCGKIEG